jgi:multidrug resistance efflux pump
MKKMIIINVVILLVILLGGGSLAYYLYNSSSYITTNNAMVQGDIVTLSAPATGSLTSWNIQEGQTYSSGQNLGTIGATVSSSITAPIQGSVMTNNVVPGQTVTVGQPLARLVDLTKLYVVANVDEGTINDVTVGRDVDVTVDAFPGTTYKGTVQQIGGATQSTFSLLPPASASGTFTKVSQNIPVTITISNPPKGMIPGLNATVRIHR